MYFYIWMGTTNAEVAGQVEQTIEQLGGYKDLVSPTKDVAETSKARIIDLTTRVGQIIAELAEVQVNLSDTLSPLDEAAQGLDTAKDDIDRYAGERGKLLLQAGQQTTVAQGGADNTGKVVSAVAEATLGVGKQLEAIQKTLEGGSSALEGVESTIDGTVGMIDGAQASLTNWIAVAADA